MVARFVTCCMLALMVGGVAACDDDDDERAGESCTVEDNEDGTVTIICPDGTEATVPSGALVGMVSGTVTNPLTGEPLEGVEVVEEPAVEDVDIVTGEDGTYSATLPVGTYTLSFQREGFETRTEDVSVVANQMLTVDAPLEPTTPVMVSVTTDTETVQPGGAAALDATVESFNATTPVEYAWTQVSGAPATIASPDQANTQVTLANLDTLIEQLIEDLEIPDRTRVVPIYPTLIEEAETATFQVEVTMDDGATYTETVQVAAELPFDPATGLRNVPTNQRVLVQAGPDADTYSWSLTDQPNDSEATVESGPGSLAYFTPDVMGEYTVTESSTGATLTIFAGEWVGAITGLNDEGRPVAEGCEACHNGTIAANVFAPWRQTDHAMSFADLVESFPRFRIRCMECHTVGYNPAADNDGIDDQQSFDDFLETFTEDGVFVPAADNFERMLDEYPAIAKRANVQCENCHGPNNSPPHNDTEISDSRITIASTDCAICHGELPRYGSYPQWKISGHANFELALEEATVESRPPSPFFAGAGHCGRCHAGQGFLAWVEMGEDLDVFLQDTTAPVVEQEAFLASLGLTQAMVQPQTCATCHNPHSTQDVSGGPTEYQVRINGDTPFLPAGFRALGVGLGALCITCHNTRNGAHDDGNPPTDFSAPHVSAQGDVLMGENAYFYDGERSPHSLIADTCVNCHMERTPPPPELTFEGEGPNHTFTANLEICADCHGEAVDGEALQMAGEDAIASLLAAIGDAAGQELAAAVAQNGSYTVEAYDPETGSFSSGDVTITAAPTDVELADVRGQMSLTLTLPEAAATPDPFGTGTVTTVTFQLGSLTSDGNPVILPDSTLVRAIWNYFLLEDEGSFGVHNPQFTFGVVDATIAALEMQMGG